PTPTWAPSRTATPGAPAGGAPTSSSAPSPSASASRRSGGRRRSPPRPRSSPTPRGPTFWGARAVRSGPYLALSPEMALGYDARTALNTYRAAGAIIGTLAAVGIRPVAEALGGGAQGFLAAGCLYGLGLSAPWLLVHRVSFERPEFQKRGAQAGDGEGRGPGFPHPPLPPPALPLLFC